MRQWTDQYICLYNLGFLTSSFIYRAFVDAAFCHLTKSKSNKHKSEQILQSRYFKFAHFAPRSYIFQNTVNQCYKSIMHFICMCKGKLVCESIILFILHRHAPLDFRTLTFSRENNRTDNLLNNSIYTEKLRNKRVPRQRGNIAINRFIADAFVRLTFHFPFFSLPFPMK